MEILTLKHPRWREFANKLSDALADADDICDNTLRRSVRVLEKMAGIDVRGTIAWFGEHGGYCDCEILMNIDRLPPDQEAVLEALVKMEIAGRHDVTPSEISRTIGMPLSRVEAALAELEGGQSA
jgi:hypothetical protein